MTRVINTLATICGMLWTLPNTLLGLLVGVIGFAYPEALTNTAIEMVAYKVGLLQWLMGLNGTNAVTFGNVIIYRDTSLMSNRITSHEHAHIYQYMCLGILFIPTYILFYLIAAMISGNGYYYNWFEIDARNAERD